MPMLSPKCESIVCLVQSAINQSKGAGAFVNHNALEDGKAKKHFFFCTVFNTVSSAAPLIFRVPSFCTAESLAGPPSP